MPGGPKHPKQNIAKAALGCVAGTEPLLRAVRDASMPPDTWRPARAAVQHAMADSGDRIWMTGEEFATWLREQAILHIKRKREGPNPTHAVGIADSRKRKLVHFEDTPTKLEALACAHYAFRFEPPMQPEDQSAFSAWFGEHFGLSNAVAAWLQIAPRYLQNAIEGVRMAAGQRVATRPTITLIRALDWTRRMGPICPYGERVAVGKFSAGNPS